MSPQRGGPDVGGGTSGVDGAAILSDARVRLAIGAGVVVVAFLVVAITAMVVLLILSNGHGASVDRRMAAMQRDMFAGSHAGERSLQANIERFNPQLAQLDSRLKDIQATTQQIGVLPEMAQRIETIQRNTSPVASLPLLEADVGDIAHAGLPALTSDVGTIIRSMQPISLLPSLASNMSTVTSTLGVLPRLDTRIAGLASTLDATEQHLLAVEREISVIGPMERNLSHLRTDIDSVTETLSTMAAILGDVRTHVANLDRKFPGAPVFPPAGARRCASGNRTSCGSP